MLHLFFIFNGFWYKGKNFSNAAVNQPGLTASNVKVYGGLIDGSCFQRDPSPNELFFVDTTLCSSSSPTSPCWRTSELWLGDYKSSGSLKLDRNY